MKNLITPEFRASFVHLAEPRSIDGQAEPKYSLVVVLDQNDPAQAKFVETAREAAMDAAREKWGDKLPKKLRMPFKDGDEEGREEWANCIVFSASAKKEYRPGIVDADLQPVIDPSELYSGMYCRVSLRPYAWSHPTGGNGVSFGLANVQKTKDGEKFSGGIAAESEFSAWED